MVCSKNDYLTPFSRYYTFTMYVTVYDLEKSFSFEKMVEITSHMRFRFIHLSDRKISIDNISTDTTRGALYDS